MNKTPVEVFKSALSVEMFGENEAERRAVGVLREAARAIQDVTKARTVVAPVRSHARGFLLSVILGGLAREVVAIDVVGEGYVVRCGAVNTPASTHAEVVAAVERALRAKAETIVMAGAFGG